MKSEFKRVAEARKSRHSNGAFCTLDVELTGNRYGIGYAEAWGIFLCQTVLFGVCDGY